MTKVCSRSLLGRSADSTPRPLGRSAARLLGRSVARSLGRSPARVRSLGRSAARPIGGRSPAHARSPVRSAAARPLPVSFRLLASLTPFRSSSLTHRDAVLRNHEALLCHHSNLLRQDGGLRLFPRQSSVPCPSRGWRSGCRLLDEPCLCYFCSRPPDEQVFQKIEQDCKTVCRDLFVAFARVGRRSFILVTSNFNLPIHHPLPFTVQERLQLFRARFLLGLRRQLLQWGHDRIQFILFSRNSARG